jgi:mannitol-1-phosphate 5-dehydrogenase
MERIVVFGAGNIGRSFIAPVFSSAGYEVVFADVSRDLVGALEERSRYTVVEKRDDAPDRHVTVEPVRAVAADDPDAVARELAGARLAATCVGGGAFNAVIGTIARACFVGEGKAPARSSGTGEAGAGAAGRTTPLDIILAENIHGAAARAREVLADQGLSQETIAERLGLVETSIGKMVPIMPEDVRRQDPLTVWAEPYNTLIVDRDAFRTGVPDVPDLYPVSPIGPWVDRKLYIHNMGHAAAAYLGYGRHPQAEYISEVLRDSEVAAAVRAAMLRSAEALALTYPDSFTRAALFDHVDDLIHRFTNRALGDTLYRVGRDLPRKLRRDDRIVGAIAMVMDAGLDPGPILEVFRAAPAFAKPGPDGAHLPADEEFRARYADGDRRWLLDQVVGVGRDELALRRVLEEVV